MEKTCGNCGNFMKALEWRGDLVQPIELFPVNSAERETGELAVELARSGIGYTTTPVCLGEIEDFAIPEDNTPDPVRAKAVTELMAKDQTKCKGWKAASKLAGALVHS